MRLKRQAGSRLALAALVALGIAASTPSARAQAGPKPDKAANEQRAKDLFAKGDTAYAEGRYEEALAAFQDAYTLSGRPQLLFNVSNALERLGRYADAVDALERYLASGKAKDREVVQKRLANLKKRVEEQKKETDRLAKEEEERRAKADAERKKPDGDSPPPPAAPPPPDRPTPVVPIILLAAGGAALVTGGVFGVLTLSARSDASKGCKDSPSGRLCGSDVGSAIDREKTFGIVTDITLASGIVLAGVGVFLLLSGGGKEASARAQAIVNGPVRATAGPGGGGLQVVGAF